MLPSRYPTPQIPNPYPVPLEGDMGPEIPYPPVDRQTSVKALPSCNFVGIL